MQPSHRVGAAPQAEGGEIVEGLWTDRREAPEVLQWLQEEDPSEAEGGEAQLKLISTSCVR